MHDENEFGWHHNIVRYFQPNTFIYEEPGAYIIY